MTLSSCRMKSPQHTFRQRNRYELHPSYHNGTCKNKDVSGARDVHPVHRETARATAIDRVSREIRRNPDYVAERAQKRYDKGEDQLRCQDETR